MGIKILTSYRFRNGKFIKVTTDMVRPPAMEWGTAENNPSARACNVE
jgi:hypothetical protein